MEFQGKLALVTGAASGIGAALTRIFVERGARVFAADLVAPRVTKRGNHRARGGL